MMKMARAIKHQVLNDLLQYLEEVARGEVAENEQRVAELHAAPRPSRVARPIGLAKRTFDVPASFFAPLPGELLNAFNGDVE